MGNICVLLTQTNGATGKLRGFLSLHPHGIWVVKNQNGQRISIFPKPLVLLFETGDGDKAEDFHLSQTMYSTPRGSSRHDRGLLLYAIPPRALSDAQASSPLDQECWLSPLPSDSEHQVPLPRLPTGLLSTSCNVVFRLLSLNARDQLVIVDFFMPEPIRTNYLTNPTAFDTE